jgi:hypothetical protein
MRHSRVWHLTCLVMLLCCALTLVLVGGLLASHYADTLACGVSQLPCSVLLLLLCCARTPAGCACPCACGQPTGQPLCRYLGMRHLTTHKLSPAALLCTYACRVQVCLCLFAAYWPGITQTLSRVASDVLSAAALLCTDACRVRVCLCLWAAYVTC